VEISWGIVLRTREGREEKRKGEAASEKRKEDERRYLEKKRSETASERRRRRVQPIDFFFFFSRTFPSFSFSHPPSLPPPRNRRHSHPLSFPPPALPFPTLRGPHGGMVLGMISIGAIFLFFGKQVT